MKPRVVLSVAMSLALVLAGCGGAQPAPTPTPTSAPGPAVSPTATPLPRATAPPATPAPGATPAPRPTPTGTPRPLIRLARELNPREVAEKLYQAKKYGEAIPLLRQLYAYLGVGLYTPEGVQVQPGAEKGPQDFYLYTFESDLLAQEYIERQLFSVEYLARFLEKAGLTDQNTGKAPTAAELLELLTEAVKAVRKEKEGFLAVRFIDSLGMVRKERLDLASPGLKPDTPILDTLQLFVISYDILFGLPEKSTARARPGRAAPLPRPSAKEPCDFDGAREIGEGKDIAGKAGGRLARF